MQNAVASNAPAAKLSMCCVYRLTMPKLSQAASHTLPMPAAKVPNKIAKRIIRISPVAQSELEHN